MNVKLAELNEYIENVINDNNRVANAITYSTVDDANNELLVVFSNRTKDSQTVHYPMLVKKVVEMGGMIKSTHPLTWATVVRF